MSETRTNNGVMTNSAYNSAKLWALLVLPFFGVAYLSIAWAFHGDANDFVLGATLFLILFLGIAIRSSSKKYHESPYAYDGDMVVIADGGGVRTFSLEVRGDPDDLAYKDSIRFKVQRTNVPEPPE